MLIKFLRECQLYKGTRVEIIENKLLFTKLFSRTGVELQTTANNVVVTKYNVKLLCIFVI